MMTREMVMELLATAGEDLSIYEYSDDSIIAVTVEDFEGFTDDWEEIDRELNDAKLVNYIREQLETKASSVSGDFYVSDLLREEVSPYAPRL